MRAQIKGEIVCKGRGTNLNVLLKMAYFIRIVPTKCYFFVGTQRLPSNISTLHSHTKHFKLRCIRRLSYYVIKIIYNVFKMKIINCVALNVTPLNILLKYYFNKNYEKYCQM